MRLSLIVAVVCVLSAVAASASAAESKQPNIVYFLVDDLGRNDCGFMGGEEIKTPHIDKLASAGAILDAYYVQPLCSPTRAALLTGRYPMRQGLQVGVVKPWARFGLPLDERTIADDLQAAGYATGIFGKWHLGHFAPEYLPMQRGFTRQYGHYNGALDYFTHERDGGFDWHKDDKICHDKGYSTTLIGKNAAQFVTDNAGKKPFFLYVPFNAVHSPLQPPRGGVDAYPDLKGQRRKYAAMLTAADNAVGAVVEAVEKAGARDNTLFVFSSDNGGPEPGRVTDNGDYRGGKGGLYEGGVRVAAFATWNGHIPAGSKVTEPVHAVDWRPTLQRLAGAAAQGDLAMDGRDAWATIAQGASSPHDVILLNSAPNAGAVRAGDWKLVARFGNSGDRQKAARASADVELYNLRDDPRETTNLAEKNAEKAQELLERLEQFAEEAVPPKAVPMPKDYKAPAVWGEAG
jgi:arylsulfatase A-like enzyme